MNSAYLEFLYKLGLFNIKLGLSTIREMLNRMGNPHLHPRIIHIAGTNGKGSTLATLERLLLDSSFTTGSTVSPHLLSFNERFRINGEAVGDKRLDQAFEAVCGYCDIDLSTSQSKDGAIKPTFFEFAIAIAFELFRWHKVEYILLETGLGGRLDATNVIEHPLACVLTRIGFDHQEFLGETLAEITGEKLGILKQGSPVFVARQEESVSRLIRDYCLQADLVAYHSSEHFNYKTAKDKRRTTYQLVSGSDPQRSDTYEIVTEKQSLVGDHQKQNTATALAVYYSIVSEESRLSKNQLASSLQNVFWRGRLEYLDADRRVLIDGAHNEAGMTCLIEFLKQYHSGKRILFCIGWKKDKRLVQAIDLKGLFQVEFLPVIMQTGTAMGIESVTKQLMNRQFLTRQPLDIKRLVSGIRRNSLPAHDLLVVAGSIYLIGEFLSEWQRA